MKDERSKYGPAENGGAILSRRSLFELAGLAVATAAIPPGAVMAKPSPSGASNGQGVSLVTDKLGRYMSEGASRALPEEVNEETKQHMLDTLAATTSASDLTRARAAPEFAGAHGGPDVATVV